MKKNEVLIIQVSSSRKKLLWLESGWKKSEVFSNMFWCFLSNTGVKHNVVCFFAGIPLSLFRLSLPDDFCLKEFGIIVSNEGGFPFLFGFEKKTTFQAKLSYLKNKRAGYYVYVSVDGTTWPDEDTGFLATWQDEFTTTYTMDCTLTASLGGGEISVFFGLRVW